MAQRTWPKGLPVYYMLVCSGITILFGETKVNNVDLQKQDDSSKEWSIAGCSIQPSLI
jgi:hypothetical protein